MNKKDEIWQWRMKWKISTVFLFFLLLMGSSIAAVAVDIPEGASPGINTQASNDIPYDLNAPYVPGEVLVKFRADVDSAMAGDVATDHNCYVQESIDTIQLYRLNIKDQRGVWDVAAEFAAEPNVEYAEPNFIDEPVGDSLYDQSLPGDIPAIEPSDPMYGDQWHYAQINMPDAWNVNTGGPGVIAAVVDTGVRFDHPDLGARLSGNGYDFLDLDSDPTDPVNGHGTHVAGTMGADTNNGTGIAGMTWSGDILPVRALGSHFEMAQGFRYACGLLSAPDPVNPTPVGVLNYSGGGSHSTTKEQGVADCNAAGVIMVCAAGNDTCGPVSYPAAYSTSYDKVIAVAATNYNFGGNPQRAWYSNCGPEINVAAPGGDTGADTDGDGNVDGVLSTTWNYSSNTPGYSFWQGTSMASPHVAGLVALMLEQGVNPDNVRSILQSTAVDLGTPGFDNEFGHGLVDAKAALGSAFGDELALDFGGLGLWDYDGTTWTQVSGSSPEVMTGWSGGLAMDFSNVGSGLWNYDGTTWTQISSSDVEILADWADGLAMDFGPLGLWNYDGTTWTQISGSDVEVMTGWADGLAMDFGPLGLWNYDGTTWTQISSSDVEILADWSGGLAMDFGPLGLWNFDGTTWSQISGSSPEVMAGWPGGLAMDFGPLGLWNYDGTTWTQISSSDVEVMTGWAGGLAMDFGGLGLWNYDGTTWTQISSSDVEDMDDVDLF